MTTEITKVVKCLKCGSFIHETEKCYNWHFYNYCETSKKLEQDCKCRYCAERCEYCNSIMCFLHNGSRCKICNEFTYKLTGCCWNHNKPLCKFCNLPIYAFGDVRCLNWHDNSELCSECNMPEKKSHRHKHDGYVCKFCGNLLNNGKCIYNCVGGGKFCIYCNYEGVVNGKCTFHRCRKENTGQFTKCAKK